MYCFISGSAKKVKMIPQEEASTSGSTSQPNVKTEAITKSKVLTNKTPASTG
jgi:hypothetical protein